MYLNEFSVIHYTPICRNLKNLKSTFHRVTLTIFYTLILKMKFDETVYEARSPRNIQIQ